VVGLVAGALAWAAGAALVARWAAGPGPRALRRALPGLVVTGSGVGLWLLSIWRA
jgi:hypothetical protein